MKGIMKLLNTLIMNYNSVLNLGLYLYWHIVITKIKTLRILARSMNNWCDSTPKLMTINYTIVKVYTKRDYMMRLLRVAKILIMNNFSKN